MKALIWVLNAVIAVLAAINAVSWGLCIREVGKPQLTLGFLLRLIFNRFFILALGSAFMAALLSYVVLSEVGVLAGRFFLSLSTVATVLACTLILGEKFTLIELVGILLILVGTLLIGWR